MIQPRGPRVLVQRVEEKQPETQHIIIPETVQDKPSQFAVVLALGTLVQGGLSVGDMVILKDFVGAPCTTVLPGDQAQTDCLLVMEEDILAVVEGV